jgi:glycosyltransferase involved in cell wall biosynthesis
MFEWLSSLRFRGSIVRLPETALRVIVEVARFDRGGLEKVVLDTTRSLDRARFVPVVVSIGPPGRLADEARASGLQVVGLPRRAAARAYARLIEKFRPHVALDHLSGFGHDLFVSRGIPVVSVLHNVHAHFDTPQLARFAAHDRGVAHYVAVSRNATLYATERLGVGRERITTIPNGIDIAEYERRRASARPVPRASLEIADSDTVLLNVAAYNLHKGHHLMAAALRRVLARRRDIRIVCVGNTVIPAHIAALRERLAREGLARHMLLPGYSDRIEDFFLMADAFLLPSFIEGWSIAMNEAMFFGLPMILTDTGGAAEVIEREDTGILLPNEYGQTTALDSALLDKLAYATEDFRIADDLAAAMQRVADNRAQWAAAGARGAAKLRARYDLRGVVRQYEAVLEQFARR